MTIQKLSINAVVGQGDPAADTNTIVVKINELIDGQNGTTPPPVAITVAFMPHDASAPTVGTVKQFVATGTEAGVTMASAKMYLFPNLAETNVLNATLLTTDPLPPFLLEWTPTAAGNFILRALVTDTNGNSKLSDALQVTVVNPPPVVTPGPNAPTFTNVTATATAGLNYVLTGTKFTGATEVYLGTTPVRSFVVNSDTQITALLYNAQPSGAPAVKTANGTGVSGTNVVVNHDSSAMRLLLVGFGDSIVAGLGATENILYYLQQYLLTHFNVAVTVLNLGVGNSGAQSMGGDQYTAFLAQVNPSSFDQMLVFPDSGVNNAMRNGIVALTSGDVKAAHIDIIAKMRQWGADHTKVVKVCMGTLLPQANVNYALSGANATLAEYAAAYPIENADRLQNFRLVYGADMIGNFMACEAMEDYADYRYRGTDRQHPTALGQQKRALFIAADVLALVLDSSVLIQPAATPTEQVSGLVASGGAASKSLWISADSGVTHNGLFASKATELVSNTVMTEVHATDTNPTHFIPDGLNGKPCFEFLNSEWKTAAKVPLSNNDRYAFTAVVSIESDTALTNPGDGGKWTTLFGFGDAFNSNRSYNMHVGNLFGEMHIIHGDNGGPGNWSNPTVATVFNQPILVSAWLDGANWFTSVNGVVSGAGSVGRDSDANIALAEFCLGKCGWLGGGPIRIAEIIGHIYPNGAGYNAADRTTNEAYLKAKYAIVF